MSVPELSAIEQRVVLLVAQGRSCHAIAAQLGLSLKTVEWHIARGRRKLERAATLHDRMQRAEVGLQPDRIVGAGALQRLAGPARTAIDNQRRKT